MDDCIHTLFALAPGMDPVAGRYPVISSSSQGMPLGWLIFLIVASGIGLYFAARWMRR